MKRRIDTTVSMNGTQMEYVAFGSGQRPRIVLPGMSDGLTTVSSRSFVLTWFYRQFATEFRG
jgi:hypothetical protein